MPSRAIATLVKIMESLPENIQEQVVAHLQEYIQRSGIVAPINQAEKLEIPAEITSQKVAFDWEEFRRRRESLTPDPNPMTVEEICELVREVRLEKLTEREF